VDEEVFDEHFGEKLEPVAVAKLSKFIGQMIAKIESIPTDSKLIALGAAVDELHQVGTSKRRICILTDRLATCYYLAAEIEGRSIRSQVWHAGMSADDRENARARFADNGEILVSTSAVLNEGISLSIVTDLMFYDLPANTETLSQVIGRFDRLGRTQQLLVHAIIPANGSETMSSRVTILREFMRISH
jgi:superfamily II DNA/RNA helicase